jgi:hypothetical protein
MSWVGSVEHMKKKRNAYRILVWKPKDRDHFADLIVDEMIILK